MVTGGLEGGYLVDIREYSRTHRIICLKIPSQSHGGLAHMVERSLSMREVPGSMPGSSMSFIFPLFISNL